MKATTVISRGVITLLSILFLVGVTFGQGNLNLGGPATTYGGLWKVKGNIDNTAKSVAVTFTDSVELKGTSGQAIGGSANAINFNKLHATGVSAKTFNVPSTITTNIDVVTGAGTQFIVAAGNKLTLAGTITNSSTVGVPYNFATSGAEVNYAGAAQSIWSGITYDKLTVSTAGGSKSLSGAVTVASALTDSVGDLSIGANTITVNGTYSVSSGGTVTGGASSNITLNGSGNLAAFTVTNGLNNLVLNRTGNTVTLSAPLTLAGAATLTAGTLAVSTQTLTLNGAGAVISGAGSLTSAATGTVDYHANAQNVIAASYGNLTFTAGIKTLASTDTIHIAGNFTNGGGAHVVTGSTVDFNGANQNIPAFTFNNLYTHGVASTKTATGNITVGGNLYNGGWELQADTLKMGTNTLAVTGASVNTNSTIQFAGAGNGLAIASGTVEYNGDNVTTQTITAGTYATLKLTNASGSGTAAKSIATNTLVHTTGDMSVPALTSLTLVAGTTTALNVDGNLNLNGTVTNNGTITVGL